MREKFVIEGGSNDDSIWWNVSQTYFFIAALINGIFILVIFIHIF